MTLFIAQCVLLYLMVILLSLFQSRLNIVRESPIAFAILTVLVPLIMIAKVKRFHHLEHVEVFEVLAYSLMWSLLAAKHIVPKIHEGIILAYTLFHGYLLIDSTLQNTWSVFHVVIMIFSVYPTLLTFKLAFSPAKHTRLEKTVTYYWFLFTVFFPFFDQWFFDAIHPVRLYQEFSLQMLAHLGLIAVQLYFVMTIFALLIVGIPLFHVSRRIGWKQAVKDCQAIRKQKLDFYVDYQISWQWSLVIIILCGTCFALDAIFGWRNELILVFTVVFPLVFFYLRWSPENKTIY